jgi:hypothetical protein
VTSTRLASFHVPKDQALLAAFGEMALCHEHMNYIWKMTIKTLSGITLAEALKQTEYRSSRYLRERIKGLAAKALGEGAAYESYKVSWRPVRRLPKEKQSCAWLFGKGA